MTKEEIREIVQEEIKKALPDLESAFLEKVTSLLEKLPHKPLT